MTKSFLFVGGDLRSLYAAKKLNHNYKVKAFGFSDTQLDMNFDIFDKYDSIKDEKYDYIVLPLPASTDEKHINSPYYEEKIPFEIIFDYIKDKGTVFVGRRWSALENMCREREIELIDYFTREELVVMNALITAEGAVEIALQNSGKTLFGSNVLITGCGRITKSLLRLLSGFGANITVTARKFEDLSWARIMGANAFHINDTAKKLSSFDIVFNTVPAAIFSEEALGEFKRDCLFIDLASKSGIDDLELARKMGLNVIWALSLPGKSAPITAGEIIADTIENILSERSG